jgi:LPXTG-motif cell wall-anchored protein
MKKSPIMTSRIKKSRVVVASALAAALLSLCSMATPALALPQRSLPAEDHLYALPCNFSESPILRSVETSDASWTNVGTNHPFDNVRCVEGPAYDPITHDSYFIGNSDGDWFDLIRVSTTDGTMTKIGEFPGSFWHPSLLITNTGVAYVMSAGNLWSLNLTDASRGDMIGAPNQRLGDGIPMYAAACSPVSTTCYVIGHDNDDNNSVIATYDLSTGTAGPPLGTLPVSFTLSIQVDSQGIVWASANNGHLASFNPTDPANSYIEGPMFMSMTRALLLTTTAQTPTPTPTPNADQPSLPDTGTNTSVTGTSVGISAALLAVGALALVVMRRRKTQK